MDAKHLLYLLELFEGKLSVSDIMTMELPLLLNLEKERADQIEREAKRISALNRSRAEGSKSGGTIVNNGKKRR
jgi:hypothetical protein